MPVLLDVSVYSSCGHSGTTWLNFQCSHQLPHARSAILRPWTHADFRRRVGSFSLLHSSGGFIATATVGIGVEITCAHDVLFQWIAEGCRTKPNTWAWMLKTQLLKLINNSYNYKKNRACPARVSSHSPFIKTFRLITPTDYFKRKTDCQDCQQSIWSAAAFCLASLSVYLQFY